MEWTDYLAVGLFQAIITMIVWFCASYISQKGKNLATREDIEKITDKIESVKIEYAKELEDLKSQLNVGVHVHTVAFEKEFKVLEEVWERLIELRNSGEQFTPGFKSGSLDDPELNQRFGQAFVNFLRVIVLQRPFFPQDLFNLLEDYCKRQLKYFHDHEFITKAEFQPDWVSEDFWKKREENLQEIRKLPDQVCLAIRRRLEAGIGDRLSISPTVTENKRYR